MQHHLQASNTEDSSMTNDLKVGARGMTLF